MLILLATLRGYTFSETLCNKRRRLVEDPIPNADLYIDKIVHQCINVRLDAKTRCIRHTNFSIHIGQQTRFRERKRKRLKFDRILTQPVIGKAGIRLERRAQR